MLFERIEPMLPKGKNVVYPEKLFVDWEGVLASPKIDGWHVLAHRFNDCVKIVTRNNKDVTHRFPSLIQTLIEQPIQKFVLDCELVMMDSGKILPYTRILSKFMGGKSKAKPCLMVFDTLFIDREIIDLGFNERYSLMLNVMDWNDSIQIIPQVLVKNESQLQDLYRKALRNLFEGLMLRDAYAPYEFGRSFSLRKMKPIDFLDLKVTKKEFIYGLKYYSVASDDGKITTKVRDSRSFKPGDVVEVAFEKKFHNGKLKFPRIIRKRIDK